MKSHHLFILLGLLALSCKKEDPVDPTPIYPDSIRAGQESGLGIHYVDLSPDLTFNGTPYGTSDTIEIDMDGNSTPDFMLTYYHSSFYQLGWTGIDLKITPLSNNMVCMAATNNDLAAALQLNDQINSSRTWSDSTAVLYSYSWSMSGSSSTSGYFGNNTDHYIGVRIRSDGNDQYGWIYLNDIAIDKHGITAEYTSE